MSSRWSDRMANELSGEERSRAVLVVGEDGGP